MALNVSKGPYVHSNYYNFHRMNMQHLVEGKEGGSPTLDMRINQLERIRDQLKSAAESFLGSKSVEEASQEIFKPGHVFTQIGMDITRSTLLRDAMDSSQHRIDKDLVQGMFGDSVIKLVQEKEGQIAKFTLKGVADAIANFMDKDGFYDLSGADQKGRVKEILQPSFDFLEVEVGEEIGRHLGNKERIREIFQDDLRRGLGKKGLLPKKGDPLDRGWEYFKSEFEKELKNRKIAYDRTAADEYLERVEKEIRKIKRRNLKTGSQVAGVLGEQWMVAVNNSYSGSTFQIDVIGDMKESEVRDLEGEMSQATIHKNLSSLSYSDYYLILGNKKVRVQAKNYMKPQELYDIAKLDEKTIKQQMTLVSNKSLDKLLERLDEKGSFAQLNLDQLMYTIANEIWFSRNEEMIFRGKAVPFSHYFNQSVFQRELGAALVNYLGVIVGENLEVHANLSNIFYAINNRVLYPTYRIVEGIILTLKGIETDDARLSFRLETSYEGFGTVKEFYKEKRDAVGGSFKLSQGETYSYTDDNLLGVGIAKGRTIISNYKVGRINFDIDLDTLLTSAYGF